MLDSLRRLWLAAWGGFVAYAAKFGIVGLVGLGIDAGIFNLLRFGNVLPTGHWAQGALGASIISTSVAIVANWIGNRYWTFRKHRRRNYLREFVEYVVVSVGGMVIALGCLWVSHYLLRLTGPVADNISKNIIGLGLGTAFRFVLYRYWVYGHHRADGIDAISKTEGAASALFEEPTPTGSIASTEPDSSTPVSA